MPRESWERDKAGFQRKQKPKFQMKRQIDLTAALTESSSPDNRYAGQLKKCDMCALEKRTGSQPDVARNKKPT